MDGPAPDPRLSLDLQREAARAIQRALAQAWGEGLAGAALIERIDQACPWGSGLEPGEEVREAWEWVREETLRLLGLDAPPPPPVDFGLFERSDHAQDEANPRA